MTTDSSKSISGLSPEPIAVGIQEGARMFDVSVRTIRREIARKNLKALRIGRVYRIRVSELQAYAKRQEDKQSRGICRLD